MEGRVSDECEQTNDTGQGEKRRQTIFVQAENRDHGQKQAGRNGGRVEQALAPGAGNRGGEVPAICPPYGDHPGDLP